MHSLKREAMFQNILSDFFLILFSLTYSGEFYRKNLS